MPFNTITILGITGGIGYASAQAFLKAGWRVKGFARANRHPIQGVEFIAGNAGSLDDLKAATAGSDLVLNGLNLPYHQWGNGAAENLLSRVIAASAGKTMLFPGNIYNYAATDRIITPTTPQRPQTYRGEIRQRMESMLESAAKSGDLQAIILRAGNFYGHPFGGDFFAHLILREAEKNRICLNSRRETANAWAYLPDMARAFVALTERRQSFGSFETFHFAGHLATPNQTFAAVQKAVPDRWLKQTSYPWPLLKAIGLFNPLIHGLVEMRYIWDNEIGLKDERLENILGENFGMTHEQAIAEVVRPYFASKAA
ncbi:NAD-dependent epimerase/dehydratase family protein [Pelagibacterium sp. H642]|uniref:NAD-dependent epimerase/dehydratase family protein n=1 Tax=Pelagibacterium sp. H642 TaxID=1881069 RepID=UPI0028154C76|nr:NAD-dependent epimerase/dehydratase family protein [Pelagibacterium sp. H642]WMT89159.1 NAD-dependent epimerase/dehydratase family protein [Pelagibacterium sp. H642]